VIPPPTQSACSLLIEFIQFGNGTVGTSQAHRIAIAKHYQKRWLGKRVRSDAGFAPGEGVVRYLSARTRENVEDFADAFGGRVFPFCASVKFDDGHSRMLALSHLEILPGGQENGTMEI
jgi:hypothetical protein